MGANSVILGAITLGKNVTVAAGAVVDIDIPDDSLVYGHNIIRPKSELGKKESLTRGDSSV